MTLVDRAVNQLFLLRVGEVRCFSSLHDDNSRADKFRKASLLAIRSKEEEDPLTLARGTMKGLSGNKLWKRLGDVVGLALKSKNNNAGKVADIGCDHGLLSVGLAMSGYFSHGVVGVDRSSNGLKEARSLQRQLMDMTESLGENSTKANLAARNLEFRHGEGLEAFQDTETVPVVCVAGIGVRNMTNALRHEELDRVKCRELILQPPPTAPRRLIGLYRSLLTGTSDSVWSLTDERMRHLSGGRWYLTCRFERSRRQDAPHELSPANDQQKVIPGKFLSGTANEAYEGYVEYHKKWLEEVVAKHSNLQEDDKIWLEYVRECS